MILKIYLTLNHNYLENLCSILILGFDIDFLLRKSSNNKFADTTYIYIRTYFKYSQFVSARRTTYL